MSELALSQLRPAGHVIVQLAYTPRGFHVGLAISAASHAIAGALGFVGRDRISQVG
jgi:hypothetical protein